jgi:hypothetical protein
MFLNWNDGPSRPQRASLVLTGALVMAGCGAEEKSLLVPVRGRVTLDDKPLPRGTVSFRLIDSDIADQPTGRIEPDGQYVVYTQGRPGAKPGRYAAVVFANEELATKAGAAHPGMPKSIIPKQYNAPQTSPLKVEVTSEGKSHDLALHSSHK